MLFVSGVQRAAGALRSLVLPYIGVAMYTSATFGHVEEFICTYRFTGGRADVRIGRLVVYAEHCAG